MTGTRYRVLGFDVEVRRDCEGQDTITKCSAAGRTDATLDSAIDTARRCVLGGRTGDYALVFHPDESLAASVHALTDSRVAVHLFRSAGGA